MLVFDIDLAVLKMKLYAYNCIFNDFKARVNDCIVCGCKVYDFKTCNYIACDFKACDSGASLKNCAKSKTCNCIT